MVEQHREAVTKGKAQVRQIAGRALARKERAEKDLATLEAKLADASDDLEIAQGASDPSLAMSAEELARELNQHIELKKTEVDQAEHAYQEAISELKRLDGTARALERESLKAHVSTLSSPDPFDTGDIALENVRNAVAELEAQAELDRELAGSKSDYKEMPAMSQEEMQARARKQLEELKAAKRRAEENEEQPTGDLMPTPRKKTL